MQRFFFHLYDGSKILLDEEGKECRDLAEAAQFALKSARAIVSSDALDGSIKFDCRIEIADEEGKRLSAVQFRDAVIIRS